MSQSILIIGAGPGISTAVAEKFGQEGYSVGLINRNAEKARSIINGLSRKGITAFSSTADVADTPALQRAISDLKQQREKKASVTLLYSSMSLSRLTGFI